MQLSPEIPYEIQITLERLHNVKTKFASLVTSTGIQLQSKEVGLADVRQFLVTMFSSDVEALDGTDHVGKILASSVSTSFVDIFEAFSKQGLWNALDYGLLSRIVEQFSIASGEELRRMFEQYECDVVNFLRTTTFETYSIAQGSLTCEPIPDYSYFAQFRTDIKGKMSDQSLERVRDIQWVLSTGLSLGRSLMVFHKVQPGSISITWLIPASRREYLTKVSSHSTAFFKKHEFIRVLIDNKCIYEADEETAKSIKV